MFCRMHDARGAATRGREGHRSLQAQTESSRCAVPLRVIANCKESTRVDRKVLKRASVRARSSRRTSLCKKANTCTSSSSHCKQHGKRFRARQGYQPRANRQHPASCSKRTAAPLLLATGGKGTLHCGPVCLVAQRNTPSFSALTLNPRESAAAVVRSQGLACRRF